MRDDRVSPQPAPLRVDSVHVTSLLFPERIELQLVGTILVLCRSTWGARQTSYVPVEWLQIEPGYRRNVRVLIVTFLALHLSLAVAFSPLLFLNDSNDRDTAAPLWLVALTTLPIVVLAIGFALWLRPRATLRMASVEEPLVEFFRKPGPQDLFLAELSRLRNRIGELQPFPAQVAFSRSEVRPYGSRVMLTIAFAIPALILEDVRLLALTPVPWLLRGGRWLLDLDKPREVRRASRLLERGRDKEAAELLANAPDPTDPAVLALLVEAYVMLGRFNEAFIACDLLAGLEPEVAAPLQEMIWTAKRTHDRMTAVT